MPARLKLRTTNGSRSLYLAILLFFIGPVAYAGSSAVPPLALQYRVTAALKASDGFHSRFGAEVWLMAMSSRLKPFMAGRAKRLDFLRLLHQEAVFAKVSPDLALALIQVESGFNQFAISSAGAEGYMQIMLFWARNAGNRPVNLFDVRTNLRIGCTILRYYLDQTDNNWVQALARYNGSEGRAAYPYEVLKVLNTRWLPH